MPSVVPPFNLITKFLLTLLALPALPVIFAAMVLVLGLRVTPLSKYASVVCFVVYPVGANNNG
mgnify:FL=1